MPCLIPLEGFFIYYMTFSAKIKGRGLSSLPCRQTNFRSSGLVNHNQNNRKKHESNSQVGCKTAQFFIKPFLFAYQ